jgi:hypothetical protein
MTSIWSPDQFQREAGIYASRDRAGISCTFMRERPVDAAEDAINLKFLNAFKLAGEAGLRGGYEAKRPVARRSWCESR